MSRSAKVMVKMGDADISGAIEGAFVNAELVRLAEEYKRKAEFYKKKADLYDMYMAVQSERYKKDLERKRVNMNKSTKFIVAINFIVDVIEKKSYRGRY